MLFSCVIVHALSELTAMDISLAGVSLPVWEVSFSSTKLNIIRNYAYLSFLPVPCLN